MLSPKYNVFILCFLCDCEEYLFDSDGTLLYSVPFGSYKIGNSLNNEEFDTFSKLMEEYIDKHNLKIIEYELTNACDYTHIYEYVFTFDKKYYKVDIETIEGSIYGQLGHMSWINNNLEDYKVYPITITKTIYVNKND